MSSRFQGHALPRGAGRWSPEGPLARPNFRTGEPGLFEEVDQSQGVEVGGSIWGALLWLLSPGTSPRAARCDLLRQLCLLAGGLAGGSAVP